MNDIYEPKENEYRDCRKCGFETFENITKCPKCALDLESESKIRSSGSAETVFAAILTIMMSVILIGVSALFVYGKYFANAQAKQNFSKPEGYILMIGTWIVLISLLSFGIAGIFTGRYAVKHGRRDRKKHKIMMIILAVGLGIGALMQALLG